MKQLTLILVVLMSLSVVACCVENHGNDNPCNFVQMDGYNTVISPNSALHFYIHSSVPVDAYTPILAAITTYNERLGRQAIVVDGMGTITIPPGASAIYWASNWPNPHEQANTNIKFAYDDKVAKVVIFQATIHVNDSFTFNFDPTSNKFAGLDFYSLMLHEMGHVVGLDHVKDKVSVMNPVLYTQQKRREFTDIDNSDIKCGYAEAI